MSAFGFEPSTFLTTATGSTFWVVCGWSWTKSCDIYSKDRNLRSTQNSINCLFEIYRDCFHSSHLLHQSPMRVHIVFRGSINPKIASLFLRVNLVSFSLFAIESCRESPAKRLTQLWHWPTKNHVNPYITSLRGFFLICLPILSHIQQGTMFSSSGWLTVWQNLQ